MLDQLVEAVQVIRTEYEDVLDRDTLVKDLELVPRVQVALHRGGFRTLGDIFDRAEDLDKVRNFGTVSLSQLMQSLAREVDKIS